MRTIHPGEILQEEYLVPLDLTTDELAKTTGLSERYLIQLCRKKIGITPKAAECFSVAFDTPEEFWIKLQDTFDKENHGSR